MIRSKRARDRLLALIDKDCGSKSTVYDPRYPSALNTDHMYCRYIPPLKIQHLKMPVMQAHEPRMLSDMTSGLHPRIGEPYRRLKMLTADAVAWDRNPCSEVALPGPSHPAIEMKMPSIEDMMLYNNLDNDYDIPV
jgi:hypothetical protein